MNHPIRIISVLLVLISASAAQSTHPSTATTRFSESDPRSPIEAQQKLARILFEKDAVYDVKQEIFQLCVPSGYDASQPYGLLIWIAAGDRGALPDGFAELLEKHHLIFIAAENAGNTRPIAIRFALALDAAFNLQKQYHIDVSRIYVGGVSGGAKVASMLPVLYSDTFCGAVCVVGVNYYRPIELLNDPSHVYPPTYYPPVPALLERAKAMNRFILITGPNDMNHDPIERTFKSGFQLDRFIHADRVVVPGMGHEMPPIERIDAAITKLDAPLPALMAKYFQMAGQAQRTKHPELAKALYEAVALHGDRTLAFQAKKALGN